MKEIVLGKTKTLTIGVGVDNIEVHHELGDLVASGTGLSEGSTFSFTPDSIGVHKLTFKNGSTSVLVDFYDVVIPFVTATEFFTDYPELEVEDERFASSERSTRKLIETVTGQKFGPLNGKTIKLQGDGGDTLELSVRIRALDSVFDQWGGDMTDLVEIAAGEPYFLQYVDRYRRPFYQDYKRDISTERLKQDFFTPKLDFSITGDFGWEYVPTEITEAAKLLIADNLNGANDLRERGINEAQLGDFSYKLNADQWGTTGNIRADILLSDFVIMRIGNV